MEHLLSYGETLGPLGFPMSDQRAFDLDALLKTLPKTPEYEYKHAVIQKAPTELNPGERSDVSWISTEAVDRCGEVVLAKGMDDAQFQGNPIVTLGHAYYLPPVGKSLWRKKVKDGDMVGIKAKTVYPAKPDGWADEWAPDQTLMLIQAGLLQGKSIGFLPTAVHTPDEKEAKKNGWSDSVRCVIDSWVLLEYAVCFLPMNQEALVEQVSKGLDIPGDFRKALSLTLPPTGQPQKNACPAYMTLEQIGKAIDRRIAQLDVPKVVGKSVELAFTKLQGRV